MGFARSGATGQLWRELQGVFGDFAGISVQAFDSKGVAVQPVPSLPTLCAFLQRYPETASVCQRDCFRKAVTCRESRRILSARCYAGLSYRVVPVRRLGKAEGVIVVGRVLTEVPGEEQRRGLVARYRLPPQGLRESHAGLLSLGAGELDRVARFVRRLAVAFVAADVRVAHRHRLLVRQGDLLSIARKATAFEDRGPGADRNLLESLAGSSAASGAALLVPGEAGGRRCGNARWPR